MGTPEEMIESSDEAVQQFLERDLGGALTKT
jgi:hypothetical protein